MKMKSSNSFDLVFIEKKDISELELITSLIIFYFGR